MSRAAREAGYKEEFLLSTGLSIKSERDGSLFDRFRDRVMFPVHNVSGRVVAFGGRTLRTDKKVAKYQNSPESERYTARAASCTVSTSPRRPYSARTSP